MFRPILLTLLCGLLAAQQPAPQTSPKPATPQPATPQQPPAPTTPSISQQVQETIDLTFKAGVDVVQAPVLVFDRDGNYVDGLQPHQFHLYDNGKEQNISVDVAYQPISLVICVQANAHVESVLPQIKKIGSLIAPLLIGDQGEVALIAFDSRVRVLQNFTTDSELITKSLKTDSGDHNFAIEISTTDQERALGLMFRRSLPENAGMLFLYDRPQPATMWMKNTLIPLDMVFISADGKVHRIEQNAEPFSTTLIPSEGPILGVLELNGGEAAKIELKRGDKVLYPGLPK